MRRIRAIGAVLVVVFALGAVAAANASAEAFPAFLTNSGLVTGHVPFTAASSGSVALSSSTATVTCQALHVTGTLLPAGLTLALLHFLTCTVSKGSTQYPTCQVRSVGATEWGLIHVKVHDLLVFTGTEEEAKKGEGAVGDDYSPESGSTFVSLEFKATEGGECPAGVPGTTAVTGSVIGAVSPVGVLQSEGTVTFPSSAIKEGYMLESGSVTKVKNASLKVFGSVTATQTGTVDVALESGENWGVDR